MRKFSVISVILFLSLIFLTEPAKALVVYESEDTFIYLIEGEPIDPADAFDKSKMVRTFVYDGVEYEDLSVVKAYNNQFEIYWFSDYFIPKMQVRAQRHLSEGLVPSPVDIELVEVNKELFVEDFSVDAWMYPNWDIVSINGEPWQNTVYVDVIVDRVGEIVKPAELLGNRDSDAWAMFMDPRTNGASHVWFGDPYSPDYPASRWTAVTDYTVDKITMYNPLNNGQPFDFASWNNPNRSTKPGSTVEKETEPINKPVEVEVFPNPAWRQGAVLVMGNPQVTIINAGTSKMNVLSVSPEAVAGRAMIPLRGVLDELGYELKYDGEKQTISLSGQEQNITLTLGQETALVDGREVELDQPAVIKDGRTLVPLRFVSENLGFKVEYDKGKISISK